MFLILKNVIFSEADKALYARFRTVLPFIQHIPKPKRIVFL